MLRGYSDEGVRVPTTTEAEARDALALLVEEQAALRRVATLVARESPPDEIFDAVTEEACRVMMTEAVGLLRFEPDDTAVLVAQSDTPWDPPPLGTRFPLDGENVITEVHRTAKIVRVDDWSGSTGSVAGMASVLGVRSAVAAPVVVKGSLWGTIIVATSQNDPLPAETESRVEQFTGLVATAIANADARRDVSRLAEEQAALRRVAVLVAQQPSPEEVFTAVTEAVGPLLGADLSAMHVFRDDVATVVASWTQTGATLPVGTRLPLDGDSATARIFNTAAAARIDTYLDVEGETAEVARDLRLRSTVGAPILVQGRLWGALMAATRSDQPLPQDAEARIAAFTELVATAVSNAQASEDVRRLVDEQAALRRVATLVARGTGPEGVFSAVAAEVGVLFGSDVAAIVRFEDDLAATVLGDVGGPHNAGKRVSLDEGYVVHQVRETGRSARFDTNDPAAGDMPSLVHALGIRSSVASPIVVEGELWGAITVASVEGPLPSGAERRLSDFTDLVATAVANAQSHEQVTALAEEQAALRRIATLVAGGAAPEQVFAAVTDETAATFGAITVVIRFEHDPPENVIVGISKETGIPIGTRWPLLEGMSASVVYRTGRSARVGGVDWTGHPSPAVAEAAVRFGVTVQVSCPIIVDGTLWGVLTLNAGEDLPPDTEQRLEKFTELVTTAVANAEARVALRTALDEQGALRRVATLVADSAPPPDVFAAVTQEIALVLGADATLLCRSDPDGAAVVVGTWAADAPRPALGTRIPRGGTNLVTIVLETGRSARIDSYENATGSGSEVAREHGLRSAVGAPIVVEGRLWGLMIAGTTREDASLPPDAEERLAGFTELVATAISNAQAQGDLASLAEQQAALRRVATLVARRATPETVFRAVADEAGRLLGADLSALVRLESDDSVTVMAGLPPVPHEAGQRLTIDPAFVVETVRRTGRQARFETDDPAAEGMPEIVRQLGVRSTVACPVVVEGTIWGAVIIGSFGESLPAGVEQRLNEFTELVATGISNAAARAELLASRARIVAAGDEARRRIQRNLHDGTQQQLVSLEYAVRAAEADVPPERDDLRAQLSEVATGLVAAVDDLQELSRGIHPPILSRGGLGPALQALARRSAIPVEVALQAEERFAESIEVAAYFVASEVLANAAKHSHASRIDLLLEQRGQSLVLSIGDNGVGGARAGGGSGLVGLTDRVEALGGSIRFTSRPGEGTQVTAEFPHELELPHSAG